MSEALEALRRQFDEKGVELQVYKEEHKIRLAGEDDGDDNHQPNNDTRKKSSDGEGADGKSSGAAASSGVLVT